MPTASPSHPHRSDTGAKDPPSRAPGRILVVSNRLPFAVEIDGDEVRSRRTVGGLVSGVDGYLRTRAGAAQVDAAQVDVAWVGWPGIAVGEGERAQVRAAVRAEHGAFPVFLDDEEVERFYDGFCNGTLWPLLHYFPSLVRLEERDWAE